MQFSDELCDSSMGTLAGLIRGETIQTATGTWVKLTGPTGSQRLIDLLYTDARRAEVAQWKQKQKTMGLSNFDTCPEGHVSPPTAYCPRRRGVDGGWANGRRCSVCVSSRWERIIYAVVQMSGLTAEKSYIDGRELDVYIPELRKAIEYNGEQHYKQGLFTPDLAKRIYKDQEKLFSCQRANIKLLFVRFDDPNPLETIIAFLART